MNSVDVTDFRVGERVPGRFTDAAERLEP